MRHLCFLLLTATTTAAYAIPVVDAARFPTVGCFNHDDIAALIHAGTQGRARATAALTTRLADHRCFEINAGDEAIQDPRWQKPRDVWSGIIQFKTANEKTFFGLGRFWVWVEDVHTSIAP